MVSGPGEPERPVAAGENQTVTVVAKVPVATPPGQHRIKLRAINVNDPDNDSTDSAATTVTVPAADGPATPVKTPFPWWIVAVAGGGAGAGDRGDHRHRGDERRVQGAQRGRPALRRGGQDAGQGRLQDHQARRQGDGEKAPDTVLDQTPAAEAKAKKDETILLTVAILVPAPIPEEPGRNCPRWTSWSRSSRGRLRPWRSAPASTASSGAGRGQRPGLRHAGVPLPGRPGEPPGARAATRTAALRARHLPDGLCLA